MGRDVCLTFKHSILMSEMRLFSWSVSLKLIYPERVSCGRWVSFPQRTKYTLFWVHHSPYSAFLKLNGHCTHTLPPHKWWALQIFAYANCRPSHLLPLANVILPMGAGPLLRCALPTFIPWLEHADLDCVAWVLPSCSCSNFPTNLIFAEGKILRKKKQNKTKYFFKASLPFPGIEGERQGFCPRFPLGRVVSSSEPPGSVWMRLSEVRRRHQMPCYTFSFKRKLELVSEAVSAF